jgi:hypothetical protein
VTNLLFFSTVSDRKLTSCTTTDDLTGISVPRGDALGGPQQRSAHQHASTKYTR